MNKIIIYCPYSISKSDDCRSYDFGELNSTFVSKFSLAISLWNEDRFDHIEYIGNNLNYYLSDGFSIRYSDLSSYYNWLNQDDE